MTSLRRKRWGKKAGVELVDVVKEQGIDMYWFVVDGYECSIVEKVCEGGSYFCDSYGKVIPPDSELYTKYYDRVYNFWCGLMLNDEINGGDL